MRTRLSQMLFISLFALSADTQASWVPDISNTTIPYGCDARINGETTELEVVIASRDPAVVVYEADKLFQGFIVRTRISSETSQPYEAVDFVIEYASKPGGERDSRIVFLAGLNPTIGIDDKGVIHGWKQAHAELNLPSGTSISVACYSRPLPVASHDDLLSVRAATGGFGF